MRHILFLSLYSVSIKCSSQVAEQKYLKKKKHILNWKRKKNGIAFVEFYTTRFTIQINIISELNEYKLFE